MLINLNNIISAKFILIFTTSIFSNFVNLIVLIISARNFSDLEFGYLAISQTIFLIFYSLSFHNAHMYLHKILSLNIEKGISQMSSIFIIRFYAASFLYLILCIVMILLNINNDLKILILCFNIIILIEPFTIVYSYFFIKKKFFLLSKISIFQSLFFFTMKVFVVLQYKNIFFLGFCYVLEYIFFALVLIYFDNKNKKIFKKFKFEVYEIFNTFRQIYLFPFLSIFTLVALRIDVIMLASMMSEADAGIYSVSSRLIGIFLLFGTTFLTLVYPEFARNQNKYIFQKNFEMLLSLSIFISCIIIFIIFIFGNYYLILFGEIFSNSLDTLKILSINILLGFIVMTWTNKQYIDGNYFIIIIFLSLAILLNIVLNYYLIPILFLNGSAIATTLSMLIALKLCLVFNRQDLKSIFYSFSFLRIIIATKKIFRIKLLK